MKSNEASLELNGESMKTKTGGMKVYRKSEEDEYYFHEGCYILEMLNTEDDPDLSIARARVEPGNKTRWHALTGVTERYLIQQGSGIVYIGDEEQSVRVGDVIVIPEGERQRIFAKGSEDLIFLALCTPRFNPECYVDLGE